MQKPVSTVLAPFDENLAPQQRLESCLELSALASKVATFIIAHTIVDYSERLQDERLSVASSFLQRVTSTHLCNHKLTLRPPEVGRGAYRRVGLLENQQPQEPARPDARRRDRGTEARDIRHPAGEMVPCEAGRVDGLRQADAERQHRVLQEQGQDGRTPRGLQSGVEISVREAGHGPTVPSPQHALPCQLLAREFSQQERAVFNAMAQQPDE